MNDKEKLLYHVVETADRCFSLLLLSFQIGEVNIAKLSDEQKAIATNKGWTLN